MNIDMNMVSTCHKKYALKIILILVFLLLMLCVMNSQNTRPMDPTNPNKKIQSLTAKHLVPTGKHNCYKEIARYVEVPSFSPPESAISLQRSNDSSILELIAFRKSLSVQVMKKFVGGNKDTVFETSTVSYSLVISSQLSNKLENLLVNMVSSPYTNKVDEVVFDGTSHIFYIFKNGMPKTLMFHASQRDCLRTKVINIFSQLSHEIKMGLIDETKIIASINEILDK
jgi:hypothetical protein